MTEIAGWQDRYQGGEGSKIEGNRSGVAFLADSPGKKDPKYGPWWHLWGLYSLMVVLPWGWSLLDAYGAIS